MSDDKAAVQPESDESLSDKQAEKPESTEENLSAAEEAAGKEDADPAVDLESELAEENIEAELAEPEDELAGLQAQLEKANSKADENMDLALRTRAEMENLRKRQSRELENAHKYALDKIAAELLPVSADSGAGEI